MAEKIRNYEDQIGYLSFSGEVREEDITLFCHECESFMGHGIPCGLGSDRQARYVDRQLCGYGRVGGEHVVKAGPKGEVQIIPPDSSNSKES